jgi:DNA gyrase subunit A
VTRGGYGLRFALQPHTEPSQRSGRRFARVEEGDEVVGVRPAPDDALLCVASERSHALVCRLEEINVLANPGRGVTVMKLDDDDRVLAFTVNETLTVENEKGKQATVEPLKKRREKRATKGSVIWTRKDRVAKIVPPPIVVPQLGDGKSNGKSEHGDKN